MVDEINTEEDYQKALAEIKRLWGAEKGSSDEIELERLAMLVHNYERSLEPLPDIVDEVRELLKQWDEGCIAKWEFERGIHGLSIDRFLDAVENGSGWTRFGSCCCSSHPPDRSFKMEVVIQPHGFTANRCD